MTTQTALSRPIAPVRRVRSLTGAVLLVSIALALAAGLTLSISVGAASVDFVTVWTAVFRPNLSLTPHQIIQEIRLPRALMGVLIGASFAVAGAMMQGMTRNPLASPGLMGLNAGANFFLVVALVITPTLGFTGLVILSFAGAAFGAAIVYGIGSLSRGGLTPVRLALAGAAVAALLGSLSSGLVIYFDIAQDLLYWYAGGIQGINWRQVTLVSPWWVVGMLGGIAISREITVLSLGEEVAQGLGQRTAFVKFIGSVLVLLLAGIGVAVGGPIAFIGLVVPHIARFLVGLDYRWLIPASALMGGLLLTLADLVARVIVAPFEAPVGAIMSLIGVPFFLYLARQDKRGL